MKTLLSLSLTTVLFAGALVVPATGQWSPDPSIEHESILDITTAGSNVFYSATNDLGPDVLRHSPDNGQTWQTHAASSRGAAVRLAFVNALVGYAISSDANAIERTTDGGQTWTKIFEVATEPSTIVDLGAWDASTAWISVVHVGDTPQEIRSTVHVTRNAGVDWRDAQFPVSAGYTVLSMNFLTKDNGVGVGYHVETSGLLTSMSYSTTDGGLSWDTTAISGGRYTPYVHAVDAHTVVVPDYDYVHRSTDGGHTWSMASYGIDSLVRMHTFKPLRGQYLAAWGLIGGARPYVVTSDDGGVTWTRHTTDIFLAQRSMSSFAASSTGKIFISTTDGHLYVRQATTSTDDVDDTAPTRSNTRLHLRGEADFRVTSSTDRTTPLVVDVFDLHGKHYAAYRITSEQHLSTLSWPAVAIVVTRESRP
ncbi:MAG TPA: hypothetical protein DIS79_10015 [Bacteroidetes bacterium]|nr:hypothetical protein [Bacteroidota bacterium]HRK05770.1 hypothetical protein [Chlorobiota bacterium]